MVFFKKEAEPITKSCGLQPRQCGCRKCQMNRYMSHRQEQAYQMLEKKEKRIVTIS